MPDPFSTPVADPFMDGGSAPGLKFETVGDVRSIVVRKVEERVDKEPTGAIRTWDDGSPKKVYVFSGEDASGEPVSLWVRGNLVTAIREATTKAGLASVIDTKVTVKFDSLGTPPKPGLNAPKLFLAKVEKAAARTLAPDEEPF